jgi:hypothetical protein
MAATAALIGFAPAAAAATGAGVDSSTIDTGTATVVESPGNAQVTAEPGDAALQAGEVQYPFFGFGGLLFHHGGDHR